MKQFGPKEKTKQRKTKITELGFDENDLWIAAFRLATQSYHCLGRQRLESGFNKPEHYRRFAPGCGVWGVGCGEDYKLFVHPTPGAIGFKTLPSLAVSSIGWGLNPHPIEERNLQPETCNPVQPLNPGFETFRTIE